jgi:hypothetical protein
MSGGHGEFLRKNMGLKNGGVPKSIIYILGWRLSIRYYRRRFEGIEEWESHKNVLVGDEKHHQTLKTEFESIFVGFSIPSTILKYHYT